MGVSRRLWSAGWLAGWAAMLALLLSGASAAATPQVFTLTLTMPEGATIWVDGVGPACAYAPDGTLFAQVPFYAGSVVTLEAMLWPGRALVHWSGDLSGTANPVALVMDSDKTVSAAVEGAEYEIHAIRTSISPATAGWYGGAWQYDTAAPLLLSAAGAPGWRFRGWSGDLTGTHNPMSYVGHSDITAVASFTPAAQTAVIYRQTFEDNAKVPFLDWAYMGNWAVIPDVSAKPGIPADPSPDGPAGLVYNKNGDYEPNADATVTTTAIDCSRYTGVTLTLLRSLTIEDALWDQATLEVSADGRAWTTVYRNPTCWDEPSGWAYGGLNVADWFEISYDLSAVADRQKTVYLRFGLKADAYTQHGESFAPVEYHGWALDDVVLRGAGPDPAVTLRPSGTSLPAGLVAYGALPSLASSVWKIGPAVAGGGQTRDADGDPGTPETERVGVDPGANAAGEAGGTVIGTALGANYPAGMTSPEYLQWGPLDLTGLQQTAIGFARWLDVGAGGLDRATVQVHVATPHPADPKSTDPMAPEVVADTTTPATLTQASPKQPYPVDLSEHYDPLEVSFTYNTQDLAAGEEVVRLQYTLDGAAASPAWVTFAGGTVNGNTYDAAKPFNGAQTLSFDASAFASQQDLIRAQGDAAFAVRALLSRSDGTALDPSSRATVTISEVRVTGVLWRAVFDNRKTWPRTEILDAAWTPARYDLSATGADDSRAVWVRWSLGPTDQGFTTEYGGWSLDQLQLLSASNRWVVTDLAAPPALAWGQTGEVSLSLKNAGTATWSEAYRLYEVQGERVPVAPNPQWGGIGLRGGTDAGGAFPAVLPPVDCYGNGYLASVTSDADDPLSRPISRWGVGGLAVEQAVAPGETTALTGTITAPPLTSTGALAYFYAENNYAFQYSADLDCDWALAAPTTAGPVTFLPTLLNTSVASAPVVTSRFTDDGMNPEGAPFWARYQIEEVAGRAPEIVHGYGDGSYRPTLPVTRDQMAVYVSRAMSLPPGTPTQQSFSDVPPDHWAFGAIEACYQAGIVTGYSDRSYRPDLVVTRDQMAKFITLAAGYVVIPAPTSDKAEGWFDDVEVELPAGWEPGDPDPRNVFRDYISTLRERYVVSGYASTKPGGGPVWSYRPSLPVTRDQLAVYLWRAFLRKPGSVVALGGPGLTAAPVATGAAPYYGYADTGTPFVNGPFPGGLAAYPSFLVRSTDPVYAYVTLDAARLHGSTQPLLVTFQLRSVLDASGPVVSHTETIPPETLNQWADEVRDPPYAEPYRNVAWAVPTGLQGDYRLVVRVAGHGEFSRRPFLSVLGSMYEERFDEHAALGNWTSAGQPTTPGPVIYPADYSSGAEDPEANPALYRGTGSLELQKTQQVVRLFPSSGRRNLRLSLRCAQDGALGANERLRIEWSPDYGSRGTQATWNTLATVTGSSVPTALPEAPLIFTLPNGDPTTDPPTTGSDDNPNLALRLSIDAVSKAKVYFDDLTIEGT